MTQSEQIDEILDDLNNGELIALHNDVTDLFRNAVKKSIAFDLITPYSNTYRLTQKGYQCIEAGGFDNWRELVSKQEHDKKGSIRVSGNAIIGDNNTGVTQGRDFLNSESPTIKNNPQQNQPVANATKKSDHTIWDKIKYVSVIIGGLGAAIGTIGKLLKWW
ncbi:hypothetical protein [Spirosoma sp.]|uniref:hypothetical protein n=1 Tax=Spirosoma sp. TaxID=1899569 RepID=UPI003B3A0C6E